MSPPRWKAKLVFLVVGFVGVLAAAWVYVPELKDAAKVVWGDARGEVQARM